MVLLPHPTVHGYEILEELGRGGMGVVYKARQLKADRLVALKMVLTGAHAGAQALARFRIEAEAVARLQHPNIVQIYEVGEQDGLPFFSLEFVSGGTLKARLDGTPWTDRRAARLVATLAEAMHYAHRQGILHRDLKPANVLLTADGQPKITDFGLAKKFDARRAAGLPAGACPDFTATGVVMGTPGYMAPEQAGVSIHTGPNRKWSQCAATDVYALGAILYELLTGRPPFVAESQVDLILKVAGEEPTPLRRLNPKVPRDLETICLKCLEKEPPRRYASAQALADDLHSFLRGEAIAARPPGPLGRLDRWARRRPALAATLLALAVFYVNHLAILQAGAAGEGGAFHWFVTAVVVAWGLGAGAFQWLMLRTHWRTAAVYGWAALDVALLSTFLFVAHGPKSALLMGYLLLVAGAALRFRVALVWFVTGLTILGYGGVVLDAKWRRPELMVETKAVVIYIIGLLLMGLMMHLLLRRLRAEGPNDS
jgi:tRNA A-37 threonylcarbamoyl transferase component Bud32